MNAELRLRYRPEFGEEEWNGEVIAEVRSGNFSGVGSAWFDKHQVLDHFIPALLTFPIALANPAKIEGGFWKNGELDQCHLRIMMTPHDNLGRLLVCAELASPVWKSKEQDRQHAITARFVTNYQPVAQFAQDLREVVEGIREEAVLRSSS